jgi:hypothetical protein
MGSGVEAELYRVVLRNYNRLVGQKPGYRSLSFRQDKWRKKAVKNDRHGAVTLPGEILCGSSYSTRFAGTSFNEGFSSSKQL